MTLALLALAIPIGIVMITWGAAMMLDAMLDPQDREASGWQFLRGGALAGLGLFVVAVALWQAGQMIVAAVIGGS